jgi:hypothetical protein
MTLAGGSKGINSQGLDSDTGRKKRPRITCGGDAAGIEKHGVLAEYYENRLKEEMVEAVSMVFIM